MKEKKKLSHVTMRDSDIYTGKRRPLRLYEDAKGFYVYKGNKKIYLRFSKHSKTRRNKRDIQRRIAHTLYGRNIVRFRRKARPITHRARAAYDYKKQKWEEVKTLYDLKLQKINKELEILNAAAPPGAPAVGLIEAPPAVPALPAPGGTPRRPRGAPPRPPRPTPHIARTKTFDADDMDEALRQLMNIETGTNNVEALGRAEEEGEMKGREAVKREQRDAMRLGREMAKIERDREKARTRKLGPLQDSVRDVLLPPTPPKTPTPPRSRKPASTRALNDKGATGPRRRLTPEPPRKRRDEDEDYRPPRKTKPTGPLKPISRARPVKPIKRPSRYDDYVLDDIPEEAEDNRDGVDSGAAAGVVPINITSSDVWDPLKDFKNPSPPTGGDEKKDAQLDETKGSGKKDFPALWNDQIEAYFKHEPKFTGTYAIDEIKDIPKQIPQGFIINTAKHNEEGEHWQAVYISPDSVEFYDSYGDKPEPSLIKDIKAKLEEWHVPTLMKFKVNDVAGQENDTDTCGYFAIRFLDERFHNVPFAEATRFITPKYMQGGRKIIHMEKKGEGTIKKEFALI